MYIWLLAASLFAAWLVGKFALGKGGFIHIFLLCAIAVAVVQFVHERRAARR
ncbi:MAG TPA: lmo0937 family membrane protein [Pyrinomonadaceae bacterium]|nr:lmo0937 family membrane protein [Pyrinomonadaceae bacterium]